MPRPSLPMLIGSTLLIGFALPGAPFQAEARVGGQFFRLPGGKNAPVRTLQNGQKVVQLPNGKQAELQFKNGSYRVRLPDYKMHTPRTRTRSSALSRQSSSAKQLQTYHMTTPRTRTRSSAKEAKQGAQLSQKPQSVSTQSRFFSKPNLGTQIRATNSHVGRVWKWENGRRVQVAGASQKSQALSGKGGAFQSGSTFSQSPHRQSQAASQRFSFKQIQRQLGASIFKLKNRWTATNHLWRQQRKDARSQNDPILYRKSQVNRINALRHSIQLKSLHAEALRNKALHYKQSKPALAKKLERRANMYEKHAQKLQTIAKERESKIPELKDIRLTMKLQKHLGNFMAFGASGRGPSGSGHQAQSLTSTALNPSAPTTGSSANVQSSAAFAQQTKPANIAQTTTSLSQSATKNSSPTRNIQSATQLPQSATHVAQSATHLSQSAMNQASPQANHASQNPAASTTASAILSSPLSTRVAGFRQKYLQQKEKAGELRDIALTKATGQEPLSTNELRNAVAMRARAQLNKIRMLKAQRNEAQEKAKGAGTEKEATAFKNAAEKYEHKMHLAQRALKKYLKKAKAELPKNQMLSPEAKEKFVNHQLGSNAGYFEAGNPAGVNPAQQVGPGGPIPNPGQPVPSKLANTYGRNVLDSGNVYEAIATHKNMEIRPGPMGLLDRFRKWGLGRYIKNKSYENGLKAARAGDLGPGDMMNAPDLVAQALDAQVELGPKDKAGLVTGKVTKKFGRMSNALMEGAKSFLNNKYLDPLQKQQMAKELLDYAGHIQDHMQTTLTGINPARTKKLARIKKRAANQTWKDLDHYAKEGDMFGLKMTAQLILSQYQPQNAPGQNAENGAPGNAANQQAAMLEAAVPEKVQKRIEKVMKKGLLNAVDRKLRDADFFIKNGQPQNAMTNIAEAQNSILTLGAMGTRIDRRRSIINLRKKAGEMVQYMANGGRPNEPNLLGKLLYHLKWNVLGKWWVEPYKRPQFAPWKNPLQRMDPDFANMLDMQAMQNQIQSGQLSQEQIQTALEQQGLTAEQAGLIVDGKGNIALPTMDNSRIPLSAVEGNNAGMAPPAAPPAMMPNSPNGAPGM